MGLKQMLATLDSEELTLQMAYDLNEQEDAKVSPTLRRPDLSPLLDYQMPPQLPTLLDADRLFAKIEHLWKDAPDG